jgi:membrane-bound lytic murein transglycosylase D
MTNKQTITIILFLALLTRQHAYADVSNGQVSIPDQIAAVTNTPTPADGKTSSLDFPKPETNTPKSSSRPFLTSQDNHPMVAAYIQSFQSEQRNRFEKKRQQWMPHFRVIDQIFQEHGIPSELKYLCVIESNLTLHAVSRQGATGPWQFMAVTAKSMGLQTGKGRDERTDLTKSTRAAAKLLDRMYREFGDWLLVVAAYNGGEGRIRAAVRKSNSHDFWTLQYLLPTETRNHVKKFMAVRHLMDEVLTPESERAMYMADAKQQIDSYDYTGTDTLRISGKFHSLIIARNLSMDIGYFNALNPDFDIKVSTEGYMLRLPRHHMERFNDLRMQILAESVQFLLASLPVERGRVPETIRLPSSQAVKSEQEIRLKA